METCSARRKSVIPQEFNYSRPKTVQEAVDLLANNEAKVLAGGMSLIPLMKLRLSTPEHVIDLGRIPDLNQITENSGTLHLGALITHHEVASSALIQEKCPLMAETATHIGDAQVRNMGTLGGSAAHADPAADYPAALCALQARVKLVGKDSERVMAIEDFFVDALTTALEPEEMITELILPIEESGTGVSYQKLRQPASGFAVVGIAARIRIAEGKISMARIGVTGLGATAYRATNVEALLEGSQGSEADITTAAAVVDEGIEANTDLHASSDYRKHVARVFAARAVNAAIRRAH
jgi:carbon-monoxide dehydrogenase medium subunit